jgi:hypothetical protein
MVYPAFTMLLDAPAFSPVLRLRPDEFSPALTLDAHLLSLMILKANAGCKIVFPEDGRKLSCAEVQLKRHLGVQRSIVNALRG